MSQQELVIYAVKALCAAQIDYMVTGSMVSNIQGVWRATHDVDFVIGMRLNQVRSFLNQFPEPEFYLSEDAIRDAIAKGRMFNVLETSSAGKMDFWMLTASAFDRSRFSRRISKSFFGTEIFVSSPEDTILAKLSWAKASGESEKQFLDSVRIYEVQFRVLDRDYLERWAAILGVDSLWMRLVQQARVV